MSSPGRRVAFTFALFALFSSTRLVAQTAVPPPLNYSNELFIIESLTDSISYEDNGTFSEDATARIRVQSPAGVQQFGLLRFPYASSMGDQEVVYVRVTKPDGTVVMTPPENVQDMSAQITIEAPFYSDLKEKQTAVKGLEIGDILEFERRFNARTPLAPGQFWYEANFVTDAIVLHEELRITVPAARAITLKSPRIPPTVSEAGGRRLYVWNSSSLKRKTDAAITKEQTSSEPRLPDVRLSSFRNWDEVAQWYRQLQGSRVEPSPEIRAKAQELTKDATSDGDKIRILYSYVGTKFRYIGIAFGIGRYQPHSAADVLSDGFGDCKDKHTLLAALLAAVGVKAYPVLVDSVGKIDPDVPSPAQFNHMITAVPQGKDLLWLDATTEVGPEGYLAASVRDKQVLLMPDTGPARLVKTPAELPFSQKFTFDTVGKIGEDGVLVAHTEMNVRGDFEVALRNAFHQTPQPQWKDVVQNVSQALSFAGTVDDVTVSSPEATSEPLDVKYTYTRKNYPSWPNQMGVPVPPSDLSSLPDDDDKIPDVIPLDPPGETLLISKIELPKGVTPELPPPINLYTDFAEYHMTSQWNMGVLTVQRRLVTHVRELPKSRTDAYRKFWKAVSDDVNSSMTLDRTMDGAPSPPDAKPVDTSDAQRRANYDQLLKAGQQAYQNHDFPSAIKSVQDALALESGSAEAWAFLANLHLTSGQIDQATAEMKKVLDLVPTRPETLDWVAFALSQLHHDDEALQTWKKEIALFPDHLTAPGAMGSFLVDHKRYAEAVEVLQPAAEKNPKDARVEFLLGRVYVRSGDSQRGGDALARAISSDPSAAVQNDLAYELAEANIRLDEALQNAQQAVASEEERTQAISPNTLSEDDLRQMRTLAAYWDTLGWVQFRRGSLDAAEKYLAAAWDLSQSGAAGDHLGQVYQKLGNREQSARLYAMASATNHAPDGNHDRLARLVGGQSRMDQAIIKAREDLQQLRRIKLPQLTQGESHGEAFLFFSRDSGLYDVKLISGPDELRGALLALPAIKTKAVFPDDQPARIIRRGVIFCRSSGGCDLVLLTSDSVVSLK